MIGSDQKYARDQRIRLLHLAVMTLIVAAAVVIPYKTLPAILLKALLVVSQQDGGRHHNLPRLGCRLNRI
ncbi:hypothetical protein ACHAWC_001040 [Mediolabrus comicus]